MCVHLRFAHVYIRAFFRDMLRGGGGGWGLCKCISVCVCVRADCMWVCGLYHQLGQFLSLCLINGLPLAPLCRELGSVCSCSFRTSCTVYTQTIYSSDTHTHPNRCTDTCVGRHEENKQQQQCTFPQNCMVKTEKKGQRTLDWILNPF